MMMVLLIYALSEIFHPTWTGVAFTLPCLPPHEVLAHTASSFASGALRDSDSGCRSPNCTGNGIARMGVHGLLGRLFVVYQVDSCVDIRSSAGDPDLAWKVTINNDSFANQVMWEGGVGPINLGWTWPRLASSIGSIVVSPEGVEAERKRLVEYFGPGLSIKDLSRLGLHDWLPPQVDRGLRGTRVIWVHELTSAMRMVCAHVCHRPGSVECSSCRRGFEGATIGIAWDTLSLLGIESPQPSCFRIGPGLFRAVETVACPDLLVDFLR